MVLKKHKKRRRALIVFTAVILAFVIGCGVYVNDYYHADEYEGIVLLAAYSTEDLSETGLHAISVYGTEDGVLNMDKYEQYRGNLPSDLTEKVIDGGCHAFFGSYGAQDGDGEPEISVEEQIRITADVVAGGL